MQKMMLIFTILFSFLMLSAQADPEWVWAHGGGGANVDSGRGVSTDYDGNVFLTGWYNGTATFGPLTLTSISNSNDVLVMKLSSDGELLWGVSAGGYYGDMAYAITTDSTGTSYITGEFYGSAGFGTNTITSDGAAAAFVAAIDTNGEWLWAVSVTGSDYGDERGYGISADEEGNCYVTGYIKGNAVFGSITLNTSSGDDPAAFVAKLDAGGNWVWAVKGGGTSYANTARGYAIANNEIGNVYATGYYAGEFDIGLSPIVSVGSGDIFVACYSTSGEALWVRSAGGNSQDVGQGIAADATGNCYVTGFFQSTAGFGGTNLTSVSGTETFVSKLDSNGTWQWSHRCGGMGDDQAKGIAADPDGNCYIAGYFNGTADFGAYNLTPVSGSTDIFAVKLDSGGNWEWAESAGGLTEDYAQAAGCDNNGNCYVTGNYSDTVMFGDNEVTGNYLDIFIARHSSAIVGNVDLTESQTPSISILHDAYPNPSHQGQTAIIKTAVAKGETGTLSIYNLKGQLVMQNSLSSGTNETVLDSRNLPSGIYLYRLTTPTTHKAKKLVLLN
jgi:hypothetical protein